MLIVGLDVATKTGVCFMDTALPPSHWRVLTVESEGENAEDKAADLALFLFERFQARRPDFVAIEMPQRIVTQHDRTVRDPETGLDKQVKTINPNALQLSALAGGAAAACEICRVPWGLVAVGTWHSAYYGKGWRPADENWKQAAVDRAILQKIPLPGSVQAQRDAAEAVGVATAWQRCTFIPERWQRAFMDLRTGKARAA